MQYRDLRDFIRGLEQRGELKRISAPVSPVLEMTEICDRTLRKGGPALLFDNPKEVGSDRIVNTLQLLYQWNPQTEAYGAEIWAVGDPASRPRGLRFGGATATLTRSYWADPVLATSVGRYGIRRETLETAIVADVLTAEHVLAWRSRRWALPSRVVDYTCPQRWAWIEPGDLVTVTDPELAWSKRLCLVQSRAWASDGSVRYTLRVQEG